MTPDVSVVIPCYNAAPWVGRAIDSVLAQENVVAEVIVVDDGSTDGSLSTIAAYGQNIRIHSGPNRGACAARNTGLAMASAEHVMFLDADDYIQGPFLAGAATVLRKTGADLAFGPVFVDHEGKLRVIPRPTGGSAAEIAGAVCAGLNVVLPCGIIWSRAFIGAIGGWDEGLRRFQDLELVLRAISQDCIACAFTDGAGIFFQHGSSGRISARKDPATIRDQARVILYMANLLKSLPLPNEAVDRRVQGTAYQLWRQACSSGDRNSMTSARELYERFGGRGHRGTLLHRISATMVGLHAKEQFSRHVLARIRRARNGL